MNHLQQYSRDLAKRRDTQSPETDRLDTENKDAPVRQDETLEIAADKHARDRV